MDYQKKGFQKLIISAFIKEIIIYLSNSICLYTQRQRKAFHLFKLAQKKDVERKHRSNNSKISLDIKPRKIHYVKTKMFNTCRRMRSEYFHIALVRSWVYSSFFRSIKHIFIWV